MEIKNILSAIIGKNIDGGPKSSMTLSLLLCDMDEDQEDVTKPLMEVSAYNPIVFMQSHNQFTQIDLIFRTSVDNDLRLMWTCLEQYGKELEKDREVIDGNVPIISLTIVPLELSGKYFITGINPVLWCLQPERPGEKSNVIRILFNADDINVFETDQINVEEIDKELEREYANQLFISEKEELRMIEEKEYEQQRNAKIEELRKNKKY